MAQIDIFEGGEEYTEKSLQQGQNFIPDGEVLFYPNFFPKVVSDQYFKTLKEQVDWKQESMNMYGRRIPFPRLTAWYGDVDKSYSFSGITLSPNPWTPELISIKSLIGPVCSVDFNSVLLNLYRNGNDSISWHTDAEKELGENPIIASANFGETRLFQLRHQKTKQKIEIPLAHGSLIVMKGPLQHFWQHQVPKTSKFVRDRINLTFRVLK